MTGATIKGLIAIAAAASIAFFGAVSTADAGRSKGGGFKGGGGGPRISSSHFSRGAKFHSGPKFHSSNKAMRYSGSKFRVSNYGKPHHGNTKKSYGNNSSHYRYGKYPYYRRYNNYPWYGASLYNYGAGCGWIYRKALSTGGDYWWDRYYRCTRYSRYY